MPNVYNLFLISLILFFLSSAKSDDEVQSDVIVKLSDQKSEAKTLKATLTPCKSAKKLQHCGSQLEIKAWLDTSDPQTKFLVIDEVYDVQQKKNFQLLHPYMVQVSNIEQSLTVPLKLNQVVEVSCGVKDSVHRRQSEEGDGWPGADFKSVRKANDLYFYVPAPTTTTERPPITKKPPQSGLETISGTYSVEKRKFQLDVNPNKGRKLQRDQNDLRVNEIDDVDYQEVGQNLIDTDELKDDSSNYGLTNTFYAGQVNKNFLPDLRHYNSNNENFNTLQNAIPSPESDKVPSYQDYEVGESLANGKSFDNSQQDQLKPLKSFPSQQESMSDARNNRLLEAKSYLHQKRLNDHLQLMLNRFAPAGAVHRANDAGSKENTGQAYIRPQSDRQQSANKFSRVVDFNTAANRNSQSFQDDPTQFEPVDKEDDPNLLVQRKSVRMKNPNFNPYKAIRRVKRVSDEIEAKQRNSGKTIHRLKTREEPPPMEVNRKISVYTLGSPERDYAFKVQIFRKQQETWLRLLPDVAMTDESANFTKEDFKIFSSLRINSPASDMQEMFLLAPMNGTSIESFMRLGNQSQLSSDEIKREVCLSQRAATQTKRSVIKLQDFGFKSAENDAIVDCPINSGEKCLILRENQAPTLKLEFELPFTSNEIIDPRESPVKISNIFIDTSDGGTLFAQFEITSKDHTTKAFNLTFTGCNLLAPLNISHFVLLPPNKSVIVNLTIPLPFYAELTRETCQANIVDQEHKKVAERNFPLDPKGARCVCLWHCNCFCFGSFLTTEVSDLCNVMSPKGEFFAGFYDEKEFEEVENEIFDDWDVRKMLMIGLPVGTFALILFIGFLKAILGCCSKTVGSWLFNYVYPLKKYSEVGCCARFCGNLFLFFLLPFAGCISICVCRSNADENFGSDDSFYGKKLVQKQMHYDEESDDGNEDARLLRPTPPSSSYSAAFDRFQRSSETVFDIRSNSFTNEEADIENDTNFVVNAIKESHESLRKLVRKPPQPTRHLRP